jgi:hypothetical protein
MSPHASYCRLHLGWYTCSCPARFVVAEPAVGPDRILLGTEVERFAEDARRFVEDTRRRDNARVIGPVLTTTPTFPPPGVQRHHA